MKIKEGSFHIVLSWFRKSQNSYKSIAVLVFTLYPTGTRCLHRDKFQLEKELFSLSGIYLCTQKERTKLEIKKHQVI